MSALNPSQINTDLPFLAIIFVKILSPCFLLLLPSSSLLPFSLPPFLPFSRDKISPYGPGALELMVILLSRPFRSADVCTMSGSCHCLLTALALFEGRLGACHSLPSFPSYFIAPRLYQACWPLWTNVEMACLAVMCFGLTATGPTCPGSSLYNDCELFTVVLEPRALGVTSSSCHCRWTTVSQRRSWSTEMECLMAS